MSPMLGSWGPSYEDTIPFLSPPTAGGASSGQLEATEPTLPLASWEHMQTSSEPEFTTRISKPLATLSHPPISSTGLPSMSLDATPSMSPAPSSSSEDSFNPPSTSQPTYASVPSGPLRTKSKSFTSSPLNPQASSTSSAPATLSSLPVSSPFSRFGSNGSSHISRIASEESRVLSEALAESPSSESQGAMILYRFGLEPPPALGGLKRASMASTASKNSLVSISSDSKYPLGTGGLVAYAFDPSLDDEDEDVRSSDIEKSLPDSELAGGIRVFGHRVADDMSWRGVRNLSALLALLGGLICLFVVYPVVSFYHSNGKSDLIANNPRINASGQAMEVVLGRRDMGTTLIIPEVDIVDSSTPFKARSKVEQDTQYELLFSDEFEASGRSFFRGHDAFWEVSDNEPWYPERVTTESGSLVLRGDEEAEDDDYRWGYTDGIMLKAKPALCFKEGLVEVGLGKSAKTTATLNGWASTDVNNGVQKFILKGSNMSNGSRRLVLRISLPTTCSTSMRMPLDFIRVYRREHDSSSSYGWESGSNSCDTLVIGFDYYTPDNQ